ncbi:MAG: restriction endonuclease [Clostridia bacterium]|nr:restriction endonuclease [Clostridia bacterium]
MDLCLNNGNLIYRSGTQQARVLTESWVSQNLYCPRCGNLNINKFPNNKPVADFYCPVCSNQFELKSKNGSLGKKVNDGAYEKMIERITSNENPDFLFMSYSKSELVVKDLILVPKHFFVPELIEKRKPLADTARRAGWVGCNILLEKIPQQGRVEIITNGIIINRNDVISKVNIGQKLEVKELNTRGWMMDILNCVNKIDDNIFSLNQVYGFEKELRIKHPKNNNIKPKIRQQLQFLRDKGLIEFLGEGMYRKKQL